MLFVTLISCTSGDENAPPGANSAVSSETPSSSVSETSSASREELVRVAVIGDWGAGTSMQRAVASRLCRVRDRRPFRDVITTGDNFYEPDGTATRRTYSEPSACVLRAPGHRWRAAWGNHDVEGDSTGTVLHAERWYAWSLEGVDFFALDSTRAARRDQRDWLNRRLRASRAPVKIVYFHHPPYTVGTRHDDDRTVQRMWVPLFEAYDVTLVLSGHSHVYEHSRVRGVDYVVTGGAGAFLHGCGDARPSLLRCVAAHHFLVVEVRGSTVTVEAIDPEGETLDRFRVDA